MIFKVGQKVKVLRRATLQEEGSLNYSWISPQMDSAIGQTGTVSAVSGNNNVRITFNKNIKTSGLISINGWMYPNSCVSLLDTQLLFNFMYE